MKGRLQQPPPALVSVVVVNCNRRDLLRDCLRSLAAQQGVSFEVILVDNGSADGSPEMALSEFASGVPFHLRLLSNPDNRGFCEANNQGIAVARGEFVALLNNDAVAEPDWIAALLAAFDGRPDVGMAASKILVYEDPARIDKAGHLIYLDGQNRGRGAGEIDHGQYDRVEEVLWPDGCACMYRKSMLDQIGGFDEDFFAYADDAELGLRARICGWGCFYIPTAVVRHHRGATLGVRSYKRLELIERNRVLLAAKLFPWSLLWLNVPYLLARIAASIWAAARNQGEVSRYPGFQAKFQMIGTLLLADLKAIPLLPKMFRKRRQLTTIRKLNSSELTKLLKRFRITLRRLTEQAI